MSRELSQFELIKYHGLWSGLGHFRNFLLGSLLLVAGLLIAGYLWRDTLAQQIGRIAVDSINTKIAASGWHLEIGGVVVESPRDLRVSKIKLFAPGQVQPSIELDSLALVVANPITQGLELQLQIEKIVLDRSQFKINLGQLDRETLLLLIDEVKKIQSSGPVPQLRIRDATCHILHDIPGSSGLLSLRQIHLLALNQTDMQSSGNNQTFALRCESDFFRQAVLKLQVDDFQNWKCDIQLDRAVLTKDLLQQVSLPIEAQADGITNFTGLADLNVKAAIRGGQLDINQLNVTLDASELNLAHHNLSFPISDGRGRITIANNQLQVLGFTARLGDGSCRLEYFQNGILERGSWEFKGRVDNLQINQRLQAIVPPAIQKFFADFSPVGVASFQFQLGNDGVQPFKNWQANIQDLACTFHKFPYRLEDCVGTAYLTNDRCGFDVQALESGQVVSLSGEIENPGPHAKFNIRFSCPGELPIDTKLFEALRSYPAIHDQIMAMNPRGNFGISGSYHKPVADQPPLLSYQVELKHCYVRHNKFDYPLRNVNGSFQVKGPEVTFQHLTAENLSSTVVCNGTWSLQDGLALRFLANNVNLDEQLRYAMSPLIKGAWDALQPEGQMPIVKVDLRIPPQQHEPDIGIYIDATRNPNTPENRLAITPTAFPVQIRGISGLMEIVDGQVKLRDMQGRRGQTWMSCQGSGNYTPDGWTIQLRDVLTGSLQVDNELVSAFPQSLQNSFEELNFQGSIQVSGGINVSGKLVDPDDEAPFSNEPAPARNEVVTASFVAPPADRSSQSAVMETSMNWDLRLDTDGAKLNSGIELSKIHGMVRLIGAYDGKTAYSEGQLKIDSLLALGMQITNIEGPLWIDSQHVGFGFFAAPFGSQANQKSVTGKLFSGQLNLDGQTWFADDTRFYLHATVDSAKLKAAAACLAPSMESIDGTAQFALRLSGNTNSQESFTGEGMIKMYNAKIYELPVLLATLKQLRRFNEDKSAFDSCNIDFSIQGRKATINRMDLLGEPISLIGNGIVDLDRNVNLNFYTIAGRNRFYVPLISELYQAGSQQIMWINVDGTLDMPQTSRQILPGINEGLKELFQIPDN